tara:strand:+ start:98 stop:421 length:324 start_codon:yes stop_codon:yes gene_type:complete
MKKTSLTILLIGIFFITFIWLFSFSKPKNEIGREIFVNKGNCASCHTLSDASSYSNIGPNLDYRKPSKSRILYAVMEGVGAMPSLEGILSKEEMEIVASYVYQVTKK